MSQTLWVTAIILKISQWEKNGQVAEEFSRSGARGGWKRLPGRCLATKGQVFFSPISSSSSSSSFFGRVPISGGLFGQGGSSKGVEEGLDPTSLYEDDGEFVGQSMSEGEKEGKSVKSQGETEEGKSETEDQVRES